MYFEAQPYRVYVKTDPQGYITEVSSSAFLADGAPWTQIDSGFGDRYQHAQKNYFPEALVTDRAAYRYRLVDGAVVPCTEEEMAAQAMPPEPSLEDRVKALEDAAAEMKQWFAAWQKTAEQG